MTQHICKMIKYAKWWYSSWTLFWQNDNNCCDTVIIKQLITRLLKAVTSKTENMMGLITAPISSVPPPGFIETERQQSESVLNHIYNQINVYRRLICKCLTQVTSTSPHLKTNSKQTRSLIGRRKDPKFSIIFPSSLSLYPVHRTTASNLSANLYSRT